MFLKSIIFGEYCFILMFFLNIGVVQKQGNSFMVELLSSVVAVYCIIKLFRMLIDVAVNICIPAREIFCKKSFECVANALINGTAWHEYVLILINLLKRLIFCQCVWLIGFDLPNAIPLDDTVMNSCLRYFLGSSCKW